jgi:hypothetical protein
MLNWRTYVMNKRVTNMRVTAGKWSVSLAVVLLALVSSSAHAWGYGPGYGPGYGRPGYGYGQGYGHGHGYGHGYGRGYGYGHGYAAGAFVVGGLLGYAISSANQPRYVVASQPVYAQPRATAYQSRVYPSSSRGHDLGTSYTPGSYPRYYLRDADGNCYLVNTFENGDETWSAVPAVNCQ